MRVIDYEVQETTSIVELSGLSEPYLSPCTLIDAG
jgi:hypothetical protein